MTATTLDIVRRTLEELEDRERKLEPLVEELDALKRSVRDTKALLRRLEGTHDGSKSGKRTRAWKPGADTEAGTVLTLLRSHPRGLHIKVICEETGIATANLDSILPRLVKAGMVERPTPGFYKIMDEAPIDEIAQLAARIEEHHGEPPAHE